MDQKPINSLPVSFLTDTLSPEHLNEALHELLGFHAQNVADPGERPHMVIYDDDGEEFYGSYANEKYDLTNLLGIIEYAKERAKQNGYWNCQHDIRKALGL